MPGSGSPNRFDRYNPTYSRVTGIVFPFTSARLLLPESIEERYKRSTPMRSFTRSIIRSLLMLTILIEIGCPETADTGNRNTAQPQPEVWQQPYQAPAPWDARYQVPPPPPFRPAPSRQ